MRIIACMSICLFLVLPEVISDEESRLQKRSLCASNCKSKCRDDDDCYTNCDSKCSNPCNRRCRNSESCQPDPADCGEVPVQQNAIILPPSRQGESISKNVNQLKNDNKVDINPNITMTNTITNTNNISVPINITSMNVNKIRVSSTDTRRIDTNITSSPVNCSGSRDRPPECSEKPQRIIIVPFPFRREPKPEIQDILPPVQSQKNQIGVQQPIVLAPPIRQFITSQFLPPVQRQEMIMPIPITAPVQTPEYFQSFPEPAPINQQKQIMWYPRQQIISQQEFIPHQQKFFPIQQTMPMSVTRPCSTSFPNQPCTAQAPVYYNEPCTTPDCMNRYPYVMTSPYHPINGLPQFSSSNQYLPSFGMNENQLQYLNHKPLQTSQDSNKI